MQNLWVFGFLERDGKFLLLKRPENKRTNPSHWNFVGGKREEGETPKQALLREAMEEIGLSVTITNCIGFYEDKQDDKDINIVVYKITADGDITLNEEHVEFGWFTKEEAMSMPLVNYIRWVLEDVY